MPSASPNCDKAKLSQLATHLRKVLNTVRSNDVAWIQLSEASRTAREIGSEVFSIELEERWHTIGSALRDASLLAHNGAYEAAAGYVDDAGPLISQSTVEGVPICE
jgi:hypothetical protein